MNGEIDDSEVSMMHGEPHKHPAELMNTIKKKKVTTVPKITLDKVVFNQEYLSRQPRQDFVIVQSSELKQSSMQI